MICIFEGVTFKHRPDKSDLCTAASVSFQTSQHDRTEYVSFSKEEKRSGGEGKGNRGEGRGGKKRNPEQQKTDSIPT